MKVKKDGCQGEKTVGNDKSGSRKQERGRQYKSVEECSPQEDLKEEISDGTVDQKDQGSLSKLCGGEEQKQKKQKKLDNPKSINKKYSSENSLSPKKPNSNLSRQDQFSGNQAQRTFFSHMGRNIVATNISKSDPPSIQIHKHEDELIHSDKGNYNEYYARNMAKINEIYLEPNLRNPNGRQFEKKEKKNIDNWRDSHQQEYRGLENLGSTCYANSALQCLHKSKYFNLKFKEELKRRETKSQQYPKLTGYYQTFLEGLSKVNTSSPFFPIQLKKFIASKNPIFEYGQNDSIQFFSTFLMALGQELKRPSTRNRQTIDHSLPDDQLLEKTKQRDRSILSSVVDETFTGYYKTTYTCKECKDKYTLFQKFNVHYLPVPKLNWHERIPTLEECLDTFQKEEQMRGDHAMGCDRCQKNRTTIKKMEVYEANQIIVICFKRFQGYLKNNQEIDIPFQLLPSQLVANEKDSQYKKKTYKLYAAIIHSGYSLNGGHYYAYCRLDNDYWLKCNDSWVDKVKKSDVSLRDAYALFYSLEDADPSKENQIFQRETNTKKYN